MPKPPRREPSRHGTCQSGWGGPGDPLPPHPAAGGRAGLPARHRPTPRHPTPPSGYVRAGRPTRREVPPPSPGTPLPQPATRGAGQRRRFGRVAEEVRDLRLLPGPEFGLEAVADRVALGKRQGRIAKVRRIGNATTFRPRLIRFQRRTGSGHRHVVWVVQITIASPGLGEANTFLSIGHVVDSIPSPRMGKRSRLPAIE